MRTNTLKNLLRLKRLGRRVINDQTFQVTYLLRDERPLEVDCEVLGTYANSVSIKCMDPRNGIFLGHTFYPRFDYLLHNVIVEPVQGLLYNIDGKFIAESTTWPIYQLYSSFPWKPQKSVSAKVEQNAILISSNSYGHWIAEDLGSTLYLIEKYPESIIVTSKSAPKYVLDLIANLDREVVFLNGPTLMRNIHWVGKSQDSGWMNPADIYNIRNSQFIKPRISKDKASRSIYASRRNVKRSPRNEYQLELAMINEGYEVYQLEKLDFMDEIALLSEAKILAGFHGSAHANAIFMPEKASLIDIVNENYWTELGHRMAESQNQNYKHFLYSGTFSEPVNIHQIMKFIQEQS